MISNESTSSGHAFWRVFGVFVIAVGLMIAIYFRDFYQNPVYGIHDTSSIQDTGVLHTRQNRMFGGLELCVLGAVIRFYGKESR